MGKLEKRAAARREQVWELMLRGVKAPSVIARRLGINVTTVQSDIEAIHEQEAARLKDEPRDAIYAEAINRIERQFSRIQDSIDMIQRKLGISDQPQDGDGSGATDGDGSGQTQGASQNMAAAQITTAWVGALLAFEKQALDVLKELHTLRGLMPDPKLRVEATIQQGITVHGLGGRPMSLDEVRHIMNTVPVPAGGWKSLGPAVIYPPEEREKDEGYKDDRPVERQEKPVVEEETKVDPGHDGSRTTGDTESNGGDGGDAPQAPVCSPVPQEHER
jgi:hypothetical protein